MLVLLFVSLLTWVHACPFPCTCDHPQKLIVDCASKAITSIKLGTMNFPLECKMLYLNNNSLTYMPERAFAKNKEMKILNLNDNNISGIDEDSFINNKKLEELHLQNNNISIIHRKAFVYNSNLKKLVLQSNNIKQVHEAIFSHNKNLEFLSLSRNSLDTISENMFVHNRKLESLSLSQNNIETIHENTFQNNINLISLYVYNNNLNTIHEHTFTSNIILKGIYLHNNNLNTIHKNTFSHNLLLKVLHLHNNYINTLHENTFKNNSFLNALYLYNNPLHCDCRMQYMLLMDIKWFLGTCQTPGRMKGTDLRDLASKLNCTACATLDPCKNDAKCFSLDEVQYECHCKPGYRGDHCEIQAKKDTLNQSISITIIGCSIVVVSLVAICVVRYIKRSRSRENSSVEMRQVETQPTSSATEVERGDNNSSLILPPSRTENPAMQSISTEDNVMSSEINIAYEVVHDPGPRSVTPAIDSSTRGIDFSNVYPYDYAYNRVLHR